MGAQNREYFPSYLNDSSGVTEIPSPVVIPDAGKCLEYEYKTLLLQLLGTKKKNTKKLLS